jgi:hypothetical protein
MNSLDNLCKIRRNDYDRKGGSVPLILNPSKDEFEDLYFQGQAMNCDEIETIGSASSIFLRLCNEKVSINKKKFRKNSVKELVSFIYSCPVTQNL